MFAFLQRSDDGIETFYSNICISIARPQMECRRGLEKMIYVELALGTK